MKAPAIIVSKDLIRNNTVKDPDTECWLWQGTSGRDKGKEKYGRIRIVIEGYGVIYKAPHAMAWSLWNMLCVPDDKCVCHKCDTPRCCNPDHLFLGTAKDNHDDAVKKGRKRVAVRKGVHARPD